MRVFRAGRRPRGLARELALGRGQVSASARSAAERVGAAGRWAVLAVDALARGGRASPPLRDLPACGDALAERPDGRLAALPGGERRALTVVGCGHVFCVLVLFSLEMGCQKGEGRAQGRMHPGKRVHLGASGSHTCVCRARCDSTTFKSSVRVAGAGCLPPPHSPDSARVLLRASLSSLIQWLLR